jgi:hypothetical protein
MKTIKIFLVTVVCFAAVTTGYSQKTKTESFKVSGECGTCKKKIESSAKAAGATSAFWDQDTKILKVSYNAGADVSAIQKSIADAGYDTPKFRAPDEAYNNLDKCCQYQRLDVKKVDDRCTNPDCKMKDGKCADMTVCKENSSCKNENCMKKSCCDESATVEKGSASEKL